MSSTDDISRQADKMSSTDDMARQVDKMSITDDVVTDDVVREVGFSRAKRVVDQARAEIQELGKALHGGLSVVETLNVVEGLFLNRGELLCRVAESQEFVKKASADGKGKEVMEGMNVQEQNSLLSWRLAGQLLKSWSKRKVVGVCKRTGFFQAALDDDSDPESGSECDCSSCCDNDCSESIDAVEEGRLENEKQVEDAVQEGTLGEVKKNVRDDFGEEC